MQSSIVIIYKNYNENLESEVINLNFDLSKKIEENTTF